MPKELPSPELLRKLLRYEPDTGKLFWKERPVSMFSDGYRSAEGNCNNWNAVYAGAEAFTSENGKGYRKAELLGCYLRANRVAWAIFYGAWPEGQIDHINGVRNDDRIENLRDVTVSENSRNVKMNPRNTSGYNGVSRLKGLDKWMAYIKINGKLKHLGTHNCLTAAMVARKIAEVGEGFSARHGL